MKNALHACRAGAALALGVLALWGATGCNLVTYLSTDTRGSEFGRTYYLGGAGPFGHVGNFDVPLGLRDAAYPGSIEVIGWQSTLGGTLRDQMDKRRNQGEGRRLARRMRHYMDDYPGQPVNIIALSAGTGIATWALENLPQRYRVENVVFLASSLSRTYDLTPALQRIDGRLMNFYSPTDNVLKYGVPLSGSVDREWDSTGAAGLNGIEMATRGSDLRKKLYKDKVRNIRYRAVWERYGYDGGHTGGTSREFIREIVAPLLFVKDRELPRDTPATAPAPQAAPTP